MEVRQPSEDGFMQDIVIIPQTKVGIINNDKELVSTFSDPLDRLSDLTCFLRVDGITRGGYAES